MKTKDKPPLHANYGGCTLKNFTDKIAEYSRVGIVFLGQQQLKNESEIRNCDRDSDGELPKKKFLL